MVEVMQFDKEGTVNQAREMQQQVVVCSLPHQHASSNNKSAQDKSQPQLIRSHPTLFARLQPTAFADLLF